MKTLAETIDKIECDHYDHIESETREYLQRFYLQLNHQPVVFTAYDFYTINLSLLGTLATTLVSYLIILVQFYAS
jgi:hypothetical protein